MSAPLERVEMTNFRTGELSSGPNAMKSYFFNVTLCIMDGTNNIQSSF